MKKDMIKKLKNSNIILLILDIILIILYYKVISVIIQNKYSFDDYWGFLVLNSFLLLLIFVFSIIIIIKSAKNKSWKTLIVPILNILILIPLTFESFDYIIDFIKKLLS